MATAQALSTAQQIYIAFYQRPADPAGLRFWADQIDLAGGNLSKVIDAFANSAEATALYGPINASTIGNVVGAIYQAAFGRAPAALNPPVQSKYGPLANEAEFYTKGFAAGDFTPGSIALAVLQGAQGADAGAVLNKVQVANAFSAAVDGRALTDATFGQGTTFAATYNGADIGAARTFLAGVTANPSSVPSNAQVSNFVSTTIANPGDGAADKVLPTITAQAGIKQYAENQAATAVLETVTATDNVGVTGFSIVSGNDAGLFQINSKGEISFTAAGASKTAASNDFETAPNDFVLGVVALDAAGNKSATSSFSLRVTDVDDRAPVITGSVVNGTRVTLSYDESLNAARQPAIGDYTVGIAAGGSIAVTSVQVTGNTVVLTLGRAPNPGEVLNVSYTPGATAVADAAGNGVAAIAARPLVADTTAPVITAAQVFSYAEDKVTGVTATRTTDTVVGKVVATDDTGVVSFNITAGNEAGFFALDGAGNIRLTAAGLAGAANDFETAPNSFNLTITATDGAGNISAAQQVTLNVTNVASDDAVAPPANQIIQMTVGNDNVTPTGTIGTSRTSDANDTVAAFFDGAAAATRTITLGDSFDTAGGTGDRLLLTLANADADNTKFTNAVSPVLTNLEVLDIRSTGAATNEVVLTGIAPSLTTLNFNASSQSSTIGAVANAVSTLGVLDAVGTGAAVTHLVNSAGGLLGVNDAVTLNLSNNKAGGATGTTLQFKGSANNAGYEVLNVVSSGGASTLSELLFQDLAGNTTLNTVNVSGTSNLTINKTALAFVAAGGKVDATNFTGALDVLLNGGAQLNVIGGGGNDRFNFDATLGGAATSINGGAGTDRIAVSNAVVVGDAQSVKINAAVSVEQLEVTAAVGVAANALTTIKSFVFSNDAANSAVTGVVNTNDFTFTGKAGQAQFTALVDSAADVLNLAFNRADGFKVGGAITAGNFETINLTITAASGIDGNGQTITGAAGGTLNILGTASMGAAAANQLIYAGGSKIDASTATGNLNLRGDAPANNIIGGSGNDTLDANNGDDTVNGGGGNDIIVGGTGADSLTGGLGNDTFRFGNNATETRSGTFLLTNGNTNNIDRISDFNGNGALAGDTINFQAGGINAGAAVTVTAITVANANSFNDLIGGLTTIAASTATVAQVADVTVSAGTLAGRYLVVNDGTAGFLITDGASASTANLATANSDVIIALTGITGALHASDITFTA